MMAENIPTISVPAETKELIGPIVVKANGVPVDTFEVAMTSGTARPTTWSTASTVGSDTGILVGPGTGFTMTPGTLYTVWARYTAAPEIPVVRACYIKAT